MDVDARLDLLEARAAVIDLISGCAQGFDNQDPQLLRSVFHEDAIFDVGGGFGRHEGISQVLAAAEEFWAGTAHMHHWTANPLVEIDLEAGTAVASVALNCVGTSTTGETAHVGGRYRDSFRRIDGRWWLTELRFELQFSAPLPHWLAMQGTEATFAAAAG